MLQNNELLCCHIFFWYTGHYTKAHCHERAVVFQVNFFFSSVSLNVCSLPPQDPLLSALHQIDLFHFVAIRPFFHSKIEEKKKNAKCPSFIALSISALRRFEAESRLHFFPYSPIFPLLSPLMKGLFYFLPFKIVFISIFMRSVVSASVLWVILCTHILRELEVTLT